VVKYDHSEDPNFIDILYILYIHILRSSMTGVSALRRAIAEVKQRWSVIGCVTKNVLSRAPPYIGMHVKPLVQAALAVVSTHQPAQGPRGGLWHVLLMCNP
jgi:hypothetical protein